MDPMYRDGYREDGGRFCNQSSEHNIVARTRVGILRNYVWERPMKGNRKKRAYQCRNQAICIKSPGGDETIIIP